MAEMRRQIGKLLKAPTFSFSVLHDELMLRDELQTLGELAIVGPSLPTASLIVVRVSCEREDYADFFIQLIRCISWRNTDEARTLIELGAGFDGAGKLLKA